MEEFKFIYDDLLEKVKSNKVKPKQKRKELIDSLINFAAKSENYEDMEILNGLKNKK